jgi:uncharacterized membrane protein YqjE
MSIRIGMETLRVVQHAKSFAINARDLSRDLVELVKLEANLALTSMVSVALFASVTLLLALTAWILLVSAVVAWIADNWLSLPLTLLVVAIVMLAAAVPCVVLIKSRTGDLSFKSTRRQLERLRHGE